MTPREWRTAQNLTQAQVAEKLTAAAGERVTHQQVSRVEGGQLPTRAICKAYHEISDGNVTPADFYGVAA